MIEVINPGVYCAIQDFGRSKHAHLGVGKSGAIDTLSLQVANRLVGNIATAPAIEIALLASVKFKAQNDHWLSVTGALCRILVDGSQHIAHGWRFFVEKGQLIEIKPINESGAYCYMAISGGIISPDILGSKSTDIKNALGGHKGDGSPLKIGDQLMIDEPIQNLRRPIGLKLYGADQFIDSISVLPGPEFNDFTVTAQQKLQEKIWSVQPNSNRMGIRLSGDILERETHTDILSQGVFEGVIQVPPNGQPLILAAECQSTGGYPRIAVIPQAELWKLASVSTRVPIRFELINLQQAKQKLREQKRYLSHIEYMLTLVN